MKKNQTIRMLMLPKLFLLLATSLNVYSQTNQKPNNRDLARSDNVVKKLGAFTNMKFTREHQYGYSVLLWNENGHLFGFFLSSQGLIGDTPTGLLEDVVFDPKTGKLTFRARLSIGTTFNKNSQEIPSRDIYEFNGHLKGRKLTGILEHTNGLAPSAAGKKTKVLLQRSKSESESMTEATSYDEWKKEVDEILKLRGPSAVEEPAARVLKQSITREQIDPGIQEQNDEKLKLKGPEYEKWFRDYQATGLASLILSPLLAEYAKANRITASVGEINAMSRAVFKKPVARGANKTIAEATVIQWKVSKALYQQYGGIVIFQQSNPYEPVGAYAKFLEEQEQKKAFEIFDPQLREAFWCYFTCKQSMIVPPKEVNYDVPWWLQKGK